MTKAEREVILDLTPNEMREFSEENCETYIRLRVKEAYPNIFGSLKPKNKDGSDWLIWDSANLVNISDINEDNVNYEQKPRATINSKIQQLREDIRLNGFNLAHLGIMLTKAKNGKYNILEGRTRLKILQEMGMTTIIADIFQHMDEDNVLRFGVHINASKVIHGEASYWDIRKAIMTLILRKEIKFENENKTKLFEDISDELKYISGGKLTTNNYDLIIHEAMDTCIGTDGNNPSVISFPRGDKAQETMEKIIGEQQLKEDRKNGIKYVAVAAFTDKLYRRMLTEVSKAEAWVKHIRFVIQIGVPKASNPEKDWIDGGAGFKEGFDEYEKSLSSIRFNNSQPVDTMQENQITVKIYGAIPQVRSLSNKYPMDRLYIYR